MFTMALEPSVVIHDNSRASSGKAYLAVPFAFVRLVMAEATSTNSSQLVLPHERQQPFLYGHHSWRFQTLPR